MAKHDLAPLLNELGGELAAILSNIERSTMGTNP